MATISYWLYIVGTLSRIGHQHLLRGALITMRKEQTMQRHVGLGGRPEVRTRSPYHFRLRPWFRQGFLCLLYTLAPHANSKINGLVEVLILSVHNIAQKWPEYCANELRWRHRVGCSDAQSCEGALWYSIPRSTVLYHSGGQEGVLSSASQ